MVVPHNLNSRPGRAAGSRSGGSLYTEEERQRRDATPWTLVQGVLALGQFLVFLVSVGLIVRYLLTGDGLALAAASVVIKTLVLYAIMITGSVWEREVFGCYLFARPFFWEDVVSMVVIVLHTAYLVAYLSASVAVDTQLLLAFAAYTAYAVNATQFVLKFRMARRQLHHSSVAPVLTGEAL